MADDIMFVIGVDDSDVLTAIKNNEILERRVQALTKEYAKLDKLQNTGRISAQTYAKAVQEVDKQIDTLNKALKKGGSAVSQLATGMNTSGKAARRNEIAFQQAGYQVQDFIVQVQAGTNPLIAFSQQGSQLAGFFAGPWGASIGMGIAAVSSLAMVFLSSSEDAEKMKDSLDGVEDALGDLKTSLKSAEDMVTSFAYAMDLTNDTLIKDSWNNLGEATGEAFKGGFFKTFGIQFTNAVQGGVDGNIMSWGEAQGLATGEKFAQTFGEGLEGVLTKETLDAISSAIQNQDVSSLDTFIEALSGFSDMTPAGAKFLQQLIEIRDTAAGFTDQVTSAVTEMNKLISEGDKLKGMELDLSSKEVEAAIELLQESLGISEGYARSLLANATATSETLDEGYTRANEFYDVALGEQIKLNDAAAELGERLGLAFGTALDLIKQAKAEAMVGLDAFGGPGEFKYSSSSKFTPPKATKPKGGLSDAEKNEKYLDNLLRETKLKAQLVGVSEQEAAKLKLLNTLEAKGIDLNDDRVKTLIEEQKNLAELEKAYEAQQEMVGMFKDTLTDALMSVIDGSRSVADAFKNMMRQILSSLAQKSIIQPLVSGLTGGLAGGAAGGLMGGLAAGTGIAATMGTIGSSLGAGFMTSVYGGLGGLTGAVSGGLAAGGAAGIATAIGAVAAPLLAVAAVFSFFKKKVKELDSGISATVTNMDSYVESFSTIQTKKFWGLSKKVSTNTTAMDADNPISAAIASVQQSIFFTAQYLGIATDSLSAFSYEFNLSLKGLSEEAKMQKIAEEVNKLGDAFANLLPNVLNMEHLTAIMNERYSLETRLLEAQGNTQALRERELANTNEYNRAILEQIFAAEDAKAALDNLNNSLKETDFATLLDFNRAKAYARLGINVANSPEVPSMSNMAASGVQAITSPMNTASGEIVQLRSEMKEMHKEAMFAYSKLIKNGKDSRDTLRSWDVVGLPAERTA